MTSTEVFNYLKKIRHDCLKETQLTTREHKETTRWNHDTWRKYEYQQKENREKNQTNSRCEDYNNWIEKFMRGSTADLKKEESQESKANHFIWSSQRKKEKIKKNEETLRDLHDTIRQTNICIRRIPGEKKGADSLIKYFNKILFFKFT